MHAGGFMYGFLLSLLVGAFAFGNMVRLLNERIPKRKHPADNWGWLYALAYWPVYFGMIFPTLSALPVFILSGQFTKTGRAIKEMAVAVFIWEPTRLAKQGLTLVAWLGWGYWMSKSGIFEPGTFWFLFAVGPLPWLFTGSILLFLFHLFLSLSYEAVSRRQLKHG